jgi:hypothetical protein
LKIRISGLRSSEDKRKKLRKRRGSLATCSRAKSTMRLKSWKKILKTDRTASRRCNPSGQMRINVAMVVQIRPPTPTTLRSLWSIISVVKLESGEKIKTSKRNLDSKPHLFKKSS